MGGRVVDALVVRCFSDGSPLSVLMGDGWSVAPKFSAEPIMVSLELMLSVLRLERLPLFCDEGLRLEPSMVACGSWARRVGS